MKRFYREVSVAPAEGGWQVTLEGRGVKTPNGRPQIVPSRPLADALAAEWNRQGEKIDAATLPLRDQADFTIDMVAPDRAGSIAKLLAYADTDTLCYRADPEDALYRRQQEVWEPLVMALEAREGIRMERISGIMHRPLGEGTMAGLRARLESLNDYELSALQVMASLAASLCIGLAALEEGADADALWNAANLEEDWQVELWGADEEAAERRGRRLAEFTRALEFVTLARMAD